MTLDHPLRRPRVLSPVAGLALVPLALVSMLGLAPAASTAPTAPTPPTASTPTAAPAGLSSAPAPMETKAPAPGKARWLKPDQFDFDRLLPKPPAPADGVNTGEIELILIMQKRARPEDFDRAKAEADMTAFQVLGHAFEEGQFTPKACPRTARLLEVVTAETEGVVKAAKNHFGRLRPPDADPRVEGTRKPGNPAYPSGHATRAWVWARVLSMLSPDRADAFMDEARAVGWGRILLGVHYPSDVAAGFALGQEIVQRLKSQPEFLVMLEEAKPELVAIDGR